MREVQARKPAPRTKVPWEEWSIGRLEKHSSFVLDPRVAQDHVGLMMCRVGLVLVEKAKRRQQKCCLAVHCSCTDCLDADLDNTERHPEAESEILAVGVHCDFPYLDLVNIAEDGRSVVADTPETVDPETVYMADRETVYKADPRT